MKAREIRLGIVMYGGVSLAVYTNGVTHELFRAVRGRGLYRLIKALIDTDVVVDVISGTSAGGINGILLAFALCNDREIAQTASLWREHGDFGRLLRDPSSSPLLTDSLLNSEGYYVPQLERALRDMARSTRPAAIDEDPSAVPELDLFVTGTDFHGRESLAYDHSGQTIYVKDHRAVFWLKHRKDRKEPLNPSSDSDGQPMSGEAGATVLERESDACFGALAKLASITSCFPGAFSPVLVAVKDAGDVDQRLAKWGMLETDTVLIDGGVLDNKPFTSTLEAIFYRTAERPVQRYLMYIEPDPERSPDKDVKPSDKQEAAPPQRPGLVRTVMDAMGRIPGYESIGSDLVRLLDHNDRLQRFLELQKKVSERAPAEQTAASDTGSHEPLVQQIYRRARLMAMSDAVLDAVFPRRAGAGVEPKMIEQLSLLRAELVEKGDAQAILSKLDVDYRLRRLMALSYKLEHDRPYLAALNPHIELLQIVRSAMEGALGSPRLRQLAAHPTDFWKAVGSALNWLLDASILEGWTEAPSRSALDSVARRLRERCRALREQPAVVDGALPDKSLLIRSDELERTLHEGKGHAVEYARFEQIDRELFPLEHVSGLHEKDIVRTIRISPIDATLGFCKNRGIDQKVCGIQAGHFGAFLKKSWRSNDVLWGRLDGVTRIAATLLEQRTVEAALARLGPEERKALADRFAAGTGDLDPAKLFPKSSSEVHESLRQFLLRLVDPKQREEALKKLPLQDGPRSQLPAGGDFETLIEAEQLEILSRDLVSVTQDAADEQLDWNIYSIAHAGPTKSELNLDERGAFKAGGGELDSLTAVLASARLSEQAIARLNEQPQELAAFFRDRYRVGEEQFGRDIPRIVLLELVSRALLVARSALINSLGERADDVRSNKLFRAFVDWPLRVFAMLMSFLRRAPATERAVVVGSIAYFVFAVAALILAGAKLVYDDGPRPVGAIVFAVAPSVALLVALGLLETPARADVWKRWFLIPLKLAGAFAFAVGASVIGGSLFGDKAPGCNDPGFPWTWLCKIPDLDKATWLPKIIALALPFLGGWLMAKKARPSETLEQEVSQGLHGMSRKQLHDLWSELQGEAPAPWLMRLGVAPRRALLRWACKHKKLADLAALVSVQLKAGLQASSGRSVAAQAPRRDA